MKLLVIGGSQFVGRYVFVSSVSVCADFTQPNDEGGTLGRIDDAYSEVVDGRIYGPLKALCEQAVTAGSATVRCCSAPA